MSDLIEKALSALNEKLAGRSFDGTVKFTIEGAGSIIIDTGGARIGDDDADVTLTASADVFSGIMEGDINGMTAFMSGKLSIDGDMGKAMELAPLLS